jgi:hypothetical protein
MSSQRRHGRWLVGQRELLTETTQRCGPLCARIVCDTSCEYGVFFAVGPIQSLLH